MWLSNLFGSEHDDRFFRILSVLTGLLCETAEQLVRYLSDTDPTLTDAIDALKQRSDAVSLQMIEALRDTFVTPLDRQDLYGLTEAIHDMIEYLSNAAHEVTLMRVSPTVAMIDMAQTLALAARNVEDGVAALARDPVKASECGRALSRAEDRVEDIYRDVIRTLFDSENLHEALKLREIYRHLSNCADIADSTGHLIGKIVVKTS